MMRFLILLLLVLVLTVSGSLLLLDDPGYVLLSYADISIETTLSMAVLIIVLGVALLVTVYRLLRFTLGFPDQMYVWGQKRRQQRSRQYLIKGLRALAEGRWKNAEKILMRDAQSSDLPLLNFLGAARAAQRQGRHASRDKYLQLAYQSSKDAELATGLTQAECQLEQGQFEQALASLNHLQTLEPRNAFIMELLLSLYTQLGEWDVLKEKLPEFWKLDIIDDQKAASLEAEVTVHLLERAGKQGDVTVLMNEWQGLSKAMRQQEEVILACVQQLMLLDEHAQAEKLLTDALKQNWHKSLVYAYGKLKSDDPALQLKHAESWQKHHAEEAVLHLTLGRLCLQNRLWGKARIHLEKSIELSARAESYFELGALLEHLGDQDAAMRCYRSGLELGMDDVQIPYLENDESVQAGSVSDES